MPLGPQAPVVAVKEGPEGISIGLPSALDARYELWRPRSSASELASCKTLAIQVLGVAQVLDVAQRDYERSRP